MIALFEKREIPLMFVEKRSAYINFIDPQFLRAQAAISTATPDLGVYAGNSIYQAVAYIEGGQEAHLARQLPGCKITKWHPNAVDIISGSGGKVAGIKAYLRHHQISQTEFMAFGDGETTWKCRDARKSALPWRTPMRL